MLWFSIKRLFQPDLYINKIKIQATWSKLVMMGISFSYFPLIFLLWIKFVIISRDVGMLLISIPRNLLVLKREIRRAFLSYKLDLADWLTKYRIALELIPYN